MLSGEADNQANSEDKLHLPSLSMIQHLVKEQNSKAPNADPETTQPTPPLDDDGGSSVNLKPLSNEFQLSAVTITNKFSDINNPNCRNREEKLAFLKRFMLHRFHFLEKNYNSTGPGIIEPGYIPWFSPNVFSPAKYAEIMARHGKFKSAMLSLIHISEPTRPY